MIFIHVELEKQDLRQHSRKYGMSDEIIELPK